MLQLFADGGMGRRDFLRVGTLGLRGFLGRAVLHHLDADHQALAAHVADDWIFRLQLFQPVADARALLERVLL